MAHTGFNKAMPYRLHLDYIYIFYMAWRFKINSLNYKQDYWLLTFAKIIIIML